jgi:hypothetical protein
MLRLRIRSMRSIGRLITLLVVTIAAAAPAAAQTADVITGRVLGPDGRPLAGVRVHALSLDTELARAVLTGGNGRYTILFPDGGGRYRLDLSYIGMGSITREVERDGEGELIVADFRLEEEAIELEAIQVLAPLPPPRFTAGEQRTTIPQAYLARVALPDRDPATVARLAPGVLYADQDSITAEHLISVAGMDETLNEVRVDGTLVGEEAAGFAPPAEGVRRVQVTTSSFDVARGGFAGGSIVLLTTRGTNRGSGTFTYSRDDGALQLRNTGVVNAATRHDVGGSYGGPLSEDRLFYNVSYQLRRTLDHRFALAAHDPVAAQRTGVSADSITRFVGMLHDRYSFGTPAETGPYDQRTDDVRLQARVDWNIAQSDERAQSLAVRFNYNVYLQDSTRINPLDVMHHGGFADRNNRMVAATLSSRFGQRWTNTLNASYAETWNEVLPYLDLPEGRVRVTSDFADGTRGTSNIIFGGNRGIPTDANNRDFQLSDEVTFLLPVGDVQFHRLKFGASVQRLRDMTRSTENRFGTFTYFSLADFEANRADRFERSLSPRETRTGRVLAGIYIGDSWRVSAPLELTFGVRWDYSRFDARPEYNPAVDAAFGRRNDVMPVVGAFSPRLGFNYRLGPERRGSRPPTLSGGIGVFAGRTPTSIFAAALRQTGLPGGEQRLLCIGDAVPTPDWEGYFTDPLSVPTTCADGEFGTPAQASRAPTVTLIARDQMLPTSLRLELAYRAPLPLLNLEGNVRYTYSRGYGLWGYRDLNLDATRLHRIGPEQRPFFGDPATIVERTGAVSFATSRSDAAFGHVFEVRSDRSSDSHAIVLQANGRVRPTTQLNANWTLGFTRDNGSGSFASVPIADDPNTIEWATANNDRRHTFNLIVTHVITSEVELSATTRLASGLPFTPLVNRDINGDGARNDRAFVVDPAASADAELAAGMERLLGAVPGRVRRCLERQLGGIARRNSCRDPWTQALDLRANFRPVLPRLQRRMTLSLHVRNTLTGLDALLHGRAGAKGWGEGQRAEPILLTVAGFEPAANAFRFEVNEAFGRPRQTTVAARNAFGVTLSARLLLGGSPQQANRGFQ